MCLAGPLIAMDDPLTEQAKNAALKAIRSVAASRPGVMQIRPTQEDYVTIPNVANLVDY